MAECIVLKGGGADLDAVTAGAGDVLAGKVIVDKDGEPLTGTMPNRGAVNQSLGVNGVYTIPAGYHNGSGKVTQNIPVQGADVSGTDRARATNMSNWEGTVNLGVRNGYYLNGVNWIQGSLPNYSAGNIKKGVNMGGVVGTFEGYVPTATDLYLRGNNIAGFVKDSSYNPGSLTFDAGQITLGTNATRISANLNFVGKTYLNVQCTSGYFANTVSRTIAIRNSGLTVIGSVNQTANPNTEITLSVNISALQVSGTLYIEFVNIGNAAVYRIWLS